MGRGVGSYAVIDFPAPRVAFFAGPAGTPGVIGEISGPKHQRPHVQRRAQSARVEIRLQFQHSPVVTPLKAHSQHPSAFPGLLGDAPPGLRRGGNGLFQQHMAAPFQGKAGLLFMQGNGRGNHRQIRRMFPVKRLRRVENGHARLLQRLPAGSAVDIRIHHSRQNVILPAVILQKRLHIHIPVSPSAEQHNAHFAHVNPLSSCVNPLPFPIRLPNPAVPDNTPVPS